MKEQKLCNAGFILTESVVGVALFMILIVGVLRAIGFVTDRIALAAYQYNALSKIIAHDDFIKDEQMQKHLPYKHASVTWHKRNMCIGTHHFFLYSAQKSGAV